MCVCVRVFWEIGNKKINLDAHLVILKPGSLTQTGKSKQEDDQFQLTQYTHVLSYYVQLSSGA